MSNQIGERHVDDLEQKAFNMGREYGVSLGSWVIDGNTSDETKRAIIAGYEDGEPEIMDMEPAPLSGEWADGPSPTEVLNDLGIDQSKADVDHWDSLIDQYEAGFSEGYWDEVTGSANASLGEE